MPLMMWWHQAPTTEDGDPVAHVHLHIAPILRAPGVARFIAGAELGSGMLINSVAPEDAAAALREVVL
jgi:UDPglucose--hexose-1-phosphate uridylyltransferase